MDQLDHWSQQLLWCCQGRVNRNSGMTKLHPDPQPCRWDPCNCQYHRDTILDQVSVVMLKMDRLCKHPNQEHLQKCGLGMANNPHYCCCSQSERFPRDTVCKCLGQNCHFEMFLLDMEGIPFDLWLLAVFLDLVHILHTEKIPMVQWAWIGRYPPAAQWQENMLSVDSSVPTYTHAVILHWLSSANDVSKSVTTSVFTRHSSCKWKMSEIDPESAENQQWNLPQLLGRAHNPKMWH